MKKIFACFLILAIAFSIFSGLTIFALETEGFAFTDPDEIYKLENVPDKNPLTFEAEIYFPQNTSNSSRGGVIIGNYGAGGRCINLEIYTNGNPRLYWVSPEGTAVNAVFNNVNVYNGQWTHLAVVVDITGDQAHCYVNGELAQTLSFVDASDVVCFKTFFVGGDYRSENAQYFKGRIKSLAIYSDMRTAQEIQSDMTALDKSDLIIAYDFKNINETSPSKFTDLSDNQNDANATLAPGTDQTILDKIVFAGKCTGTASYVIDETEEEPIEEPVIGVKLDINAIPGSNKVVHINNALAMADSMVFQGVLTFTTTVYNPNDHDITIGVQLKNGWGDLASNPYREIIVSAGTKRTVTLNVDLSESTNGIKEDINVRYNLVDGYQVGDEIYFSAEDAGTGFVDASTWWVQESTNIATAVTELPELEKVGYAEPVGARIKYTGTNSIVHVTGNYITDTTVTTTIYNTNYHDITVGVQLKDGWNDFDPVPYEEVVIPARFKKTVTLTAEGADPSTINLRYTVVDGLVTGDSIIVSIENVLDSFYTADWYTPESEYATVTELPMLPEVPAPTDQYVQYKINNDETVTIIGFDEDHSGEIVVPYTIAGYPVTKIGAEAFKNCEGLITIILSENLKSIGNGAFDGCDNLENVCYLGTQAQWEDIEIGADNDALLNATISYEYAAGKISGADVEIGSSLTINYFVQSAVNVNRLKMRFTVSTGKVVYVDGVKDEQTGFYKFAYTNINPQCMNDTITAELMLDEKTLATKENYSVKAYCENQLSRTKNELGFNTWNQYDAFKKLLADMLVYGAESQKYMNYNAENLPDTEAWVQEYKSTFTAPTGVKVITGNKDRNNCIKSASLNMANVNKIYFRLILTDANVKVLLNEVEVNKEELDLQKDGTYLLYTDGILATEFDKVFTVTLLDGNDNQLSKIEYNVNAFVQSKNQSTTIGDIVQALNNYGQSAQEFRAALNDNSGEFDIGEEDVVA